MVPRATKIRLFRATVESVLLYGSETWTVTKKLEESVNGCYTRMMRTALNVHWQQHMNEELYGSLPRISETIRARRLRLPGHRRRHNEETASKVLLGNVPQKSHPNRGRPRTTYIDTIKADTGLYNTTEMRRNAQSSRVERFY